MFGYSKSQLCSSIRASLNNIKQQKWSWLGFQIFFCDELVNHLIDTGLIATQKQADRFDEWCYRIITAITKQAGIENELAPMSTNDVDKLQAVCDKQMHVFVVK